MNFFIGLAIGCLIGHLCGWVNAHKTVETECEKLGGFYVGKKVFKCVKVETPSEETE